MKTRDLTKGSIFKCIISFSLPLFFGMLFQQFYNMVDTIIVGNTLGLEALAGVGSTGSINFLIIGFCNGTASGFCIPLATCFGGKDLKRLRKYLINAIYVGIVFVALLTFLSCIFCGQILKLLDTLNESYQYAYNYIFFIFLGIPATFLYNLLSGILRAIGDSKSSVIILIIGIILNICLDCLFLIVFRYGVEFAAHATNIAQIITALIAFIFIKIKYPELKIQRDEYKINFKYIWRLLSLGIPMGLQYSITAIGSILITKSVNSLNSTIYVASMSSGSKVSQFFSTPFDALGATMATFGSQNIGAKKYERLSKGVIFSCVIGFIYSLIAFLVLFLFGKQIASLFLENPTEDVLNATRTFLVINSSCYILLTIVNVVRFMIQGMGFSYIAMISGLLEMIGRSVVAIFLVKSIGFIGACFASPLAWILADLFLIPCFIVSKNKVQKKNII